MIILKILLIIILVILGTVLILLLMPVRVKFEFIGEKVNYHLKYGFLNIIDSSGGGLVSRLTKKRSESKKSENSKAEKSSAEDNSGIQAEKSEVSESAAEKDNVESSSPEEPQENSAAEEASSDGSDSDAADTAETKKTLGEKVGFILEIWNSAKKPVRKIFKGFHFTDIMIDFVIADEDAYKCALKYGKISGAVFNLLAFMRLVFTSKEKTIDVRAGFGQEKSRWDAGVKVYFLPITAVISGIWFLITYIFRIYLPHKKSAKKSVGQQKSMPKGECEV
ncbi:MAG: hypothetical protein PUA81_08715 [Oscillospiraceae bacterium]|nr:hypothetical protein [Oscillospiraceae bacterium]